MTIYIGADHRGFALKEHLKKILKDEAYDIVDVGAAAYDKDDDYPAFAKAVAENVDKAPERDRGVLICGSGFGVDITANKFPGIRAALPISADHAYQARHDDNANILCFAADFTDEAAAENIMKTFLATPFAEDARYARRLEEIGKIEEKI